MPQNETQRVTLSGLANYVNGAGHSIKPVVAGYGPFEAILLDDQITGTVATATTLASELQFRLRNDEAAFADKVIVGGAYGAWGMGRFAVADANCLSIADAAGLRPGDGDFAVACWFITDDLDTRNPVAKWSGAADWHVQMNSNGSIQLAVFGDSGGTVASAVTAAGVIEAGTLYFIYADYQHSTKAIRISVNDGSFATGTGGWTTRGSANAALKIGEIGTLGRYWNGLIGPVGYWIGRRLSGGEISSLYNGGAPKGYADLTSGEKASLAGWWGMTSPATLTTDESGDGRTLTNNNAVAWGDGAIVLTATFDASLGDLPEMTIAQEIELIEEVTQQGIDPGEFESGQQEIHTVTASRVVTGGSWVCEGQTIAWNETPNTPNWFGDQPLSAGVVSLTSVAAGAYGDEALAPTNIDLVFATITATVETIQDGAFGGGGGAMIHLLSGAI